MLLLWNTTYDTIYFNENEGDKNMLHKYWLPLTIITIIVSLISIKGFPIALGALYLPVLSIETTCKVSFPLFSFVLILSLINDSASSSRLIEYTCSEGTPKAS